VDEGSLQLLAERGVKLIAPRSAGYNNLDLAAAVRLGFKAVYVPAYTPHAVAELVFALTLALIRHVPRAYQRTRDENFSVEGLVGTQLNGPSGSSALERSVVWSPVSPTALAAE